MNKELQEHNLKSAIQEEAKNIIRIYIEVLFYYPILLRLIYFLLQNSIASSSLQWVETSFVFKIIIFSILSCVIVYTKNKDIFGHMFQLADSQDRNIGVILSLSFILISLHLLFPVQSYALSVSDTLIVIAGAIANGILFQGVLAHHLAKYGKIFTLVVISVFNGIFYSLNMPCFHAFLFGLLLGYITLEYSLGVSILAHALIQVTIVFMPAWIVDHSVLSTLSIIFLITGIILFVLNLKKIKAYIHKYSCSSNNYRYFFASPWVIISLFMVLTIIILKLNL